MEGDVKLQVVCDQHRFKLPMTSGYYDRFMQHHADCNWTGTRIELVEFPSPRRSRAYADVSLHYDAAVRPMTGDPAKGLQFYESRYGAAHPDDAKSS